jgi:hypothetical protein
MKCHYEEQIDVAILVKKYKRLCEYLEFSKVNHGTEA